MPPIISEPNQSADFTEILEAVEFELQRLDLTWESERVQRFILAMHQRHGWIPSSPMQAIYGMSEQQILKLFQKLQEASK